ncbi:response regulator transcription factor [Laceyella putida]|uniref:Response regulator transcription factor n=1 Tax=Laceyella putida TaxID=110101 RepID=A0ABW2RGV5_9BACL
MAMILIVEDESELSQLIARHLHLDMHETILAQTGQEGMELWREKKPDLVILDWNLPDMEGVAVCQKMRESSVTPVIMLTARGHEMERIWGLDVGADDYMTKPFSMGELRARVRSLLRRMAMMHQHGASPVQPPKILDYGFIQLDPEKREVSIDQRLLELTPKEYELLHLFLKHPGRVFSRKYLLEKVWDITYEGFDRTVDTHISRLRGKLKPYSSSLQTVWGTGYKFVIERVDP